MSFDSQKYVRKLLFTVTIGIVFLYFWKNFTNIDLKKKDPTGIKNCKKGIVCFIIVGLQESILYVIESCTKITIKVAYIRDELTECLDVLYQCSFNVRAIVYDNHQSNVSLFTNYWRDAIKTQTIYVWIIN